MAQKEGTGEREIIRNVSVDIYITAPYSLDMDCVLPAATYEVGLDEGNLVVVQPTSHKKQSSRNFSSV